MATLREVITRFRFETNDSDFHGFNQKLGTMKSGLRNLAAIFGVTLGVAGGVAITRMGLSADRAEFNLKRLAGTDFGRFRTALKSIRSEMEGIRSGSSAIVRPRQFDEAAAQFAKVFGTGERQVGNFQRIFSFAAKQAALTGRNVVEISNEIVQAIQGGGFEALLDIPGFTEFRRQMLEFQQGIIDPKEPGFEAARANRMRALMAIMGQASEQQNKDLKRLDGNLLTADTTANKLQDTLESIGKTLSEILVPVLQKLADLLDWINKKVKEWDRASAKAGENPAAFVTRRAGGAIKEALVGPDIDYAEADAAAKSPVDRIINRARLKLRQLGYPVDAPKSPDVVPAGQPGGVYIENQNNTFQITAPDSIAAGREVQRILDETIQDTRAQNLPVEGR